MQIATRGPALCRELGRGPFGWREVRFEIDSADPGARLPAPGELEHEPHLGVFGALASLEPGHGHEAAAEGVLLAGSPVVKAVVNVSSRQPEPVHRLAPTLDLDREPPSSERPGDSSSRRSRTRYRARPRRGWGGECRAPRLPLRRRAWTPRQYCSVANRGGAADLPARDLDNGR